MLISFAKYTIVNIYNKTMLKKKKIVTSAFFGKFYFRTTMAYINNLYANFTDVVEINVFYIPKCSIIHYSLSHPSYYFRKIVVI